MAPCFIHERDNILSDMNDYSQQLERVTREIEECEDESTYQQLNNRRTYILNTIQFYASLLSTSREESF